MSIGRLGALIKPRWTIFWRETSQISVTITIQRQLRPWNTNSKLPFMGLKPKQSIMYWEIGLIEWGTVRPAVAVNLIVLCCILKWKGSIFLMKPYSWRNIDKFLFNSWFKFQMLDGPPCTWFKIHVHRAIAIMHQNDLITVFRVLKDVKSEYAWVRFWKHIKLKMP